MCLHYFSLPPFREPESSGRRDFFFVRILLSRLLYHLQLKEVYITRKSVTVLPALPAPPLIHCQEGEREMNDADRAASVSMVRMDVVLVCHQTSSRKPRLSLSGNSDSAVNSYISLDK